MAGFLAVDIEVLDRTVRQLRDAQQLLEDSAAAMAVGAHSTLGPRVLDEAADRFHRRWCTGVEHLGRAACSTAEGVAQCRDAYLERDARFASALATRDPGGENRADE